MTIHHGENHNPRVSTRDLYAAMSDDEVRAYWEWAISICPGALQLVRAGQYHVPPSFPDRERTLRILGEIGAE